MNEMLIQELRRVASLTSLKEIFVKRGFTTEVPGTLIGVSGISHNFSLVAGNGDRTIVVDLVRTRNGAEVSVGDVLALYGKNIDVQPSGSVLIAIPRMSTEARKLADAKSIDFIEASDPAAVGPLVDKLTDVLDSCPESKVILEVPQKRPAVA